MAIFPASGKPIKIPVKPRFPPHLTDQDTDLLVRRIQQGIESFHEKRRDRDVMLPERGGRSLAEWIRLLRAVGGGAHVDHRTAPIAREDLYRIVEDPGAPSAMRAGAAVALGGGLDEAGRARLRIAATATAAPEVRALLELSAEEADEAALEKALARIARA